MKFRADPIQLTPPASDPAALPHDLPPDEAADAPATAAPTSWKDRLLRLGGSWVGFTGLYAVTGGGACPFCGQPSCPTGFLSAGVVGGVLAVGLQAWREKRAGKERPQ